MVHSMIMGVAFSSMPSGWCSKLDMGGGFEGEPKANSHLSFFETGCRSISVAFSQGPCLNVHKQGRCRVIRCWSWQARLVVLLKCAGCAQRLLRHGLSGASQRRMVRVEKEAGRNDILLSRCCVA